MQLLGHLNIIDLIFGTNKKIIVLSVPILKHITVISVLALPTGCLWWDHGLSYVTS